MLNVYHEDKYEQSDKKLLGVYYKDAQLKGIRLFESEYEKTKNSNESLQNASSTCGKTFHSEPMQRACQRGAFDAFRNTNRQDLLKKLRDGTLRLEDIEKRPLPPKPVRKSKKMD